MNVINTLVWGNTRSLIRTLDDLVEEFGEFTKREKTDNDNLLKYTFINETKYHLKPNRKYEKLVISINTTTKEVESHYMGGRYFLKDVVKKEPTIRWLFDASEKGYDQYISSVKPEYQLKPYQLLSDINLLDKKIKKIICQDAAKLLMLGKVEIHFDYGDTILREGTHYEQSIVYAAYTEHQLGEILHARWRYEKSMGL